MTDPPYGKVYRECLSFLHRAADTELDLRASTYPSLSPAALKEALWGAAEQVARDIGFDGDVAYAAATEYARDECASWAAAQAEEEADPA